MRRSALNQQQSRLKNHSLYFVLGLLSTSQHLEAQLTELPPESRSEVMSADQNKDFLYLCLGLVAFSQDVQGRLTLEYDLTTRDAKPSAPHHPDTLSNALY